MDNKQDSILTSIKKLLGIMNDYKHFDQDIIMHINSSFLDLSQLGVGPKEGFFIEDETAVWTDFIPEGILQSAVKTFIYLKVRLLFDPPTSSGAIESINRQLDKIEWRINIEVESGQENTEVNQNG